MRVTSTGEDVGGGRFRADLEGLRGVAVALVVLYHAGLLHLSGGFVGVDVFYVLSGTMTRSAAVDAALWRAVAADTTANGGRYLGTDRWACPGSVCPVLAGDVLVYRDDTHLSLPFVDFLRPRLERALLARLK